MLCLCRMMTPAGGCCPCRSNLCFGLCKSGEGEKSPPPYLLLDRASLLTSRESGITKRAVRLLQCCLVHSGAWSCSVGLTVLPFPQAVWQLPPGDHRARLDHGQGAGERGQLPLLETHPCRGVQVRAAGSLPQAGTGSAARGKLEELLIGSSGSCSDAPRVLQGGTMGCVWNSRHTLEELSAFASPANHSWGSHPS